MCMIKNDQLTLSSTYTGFDGVHFLGCVFVADSSVGDLHVVFSGCTFENCKFEDCVIPNTSFLGCTFINSNVFDECSMENMVVSSCVFNSNMVFNNCALSDMVIRDSEILDRVSFKHCNMANAVIDLAKMYVNDNGSRVSEFDKRLVIKSCWIGEDLLENVSSVKQIALIDIS